MSKTDNKENKTKEIFNKIVEGVQNIVNSGEYAKFLKFSKNFHNYSFNLKKGAKGIQIIYPIKRSYTKKKLEGQDSLLDAEEKTAQGEKVEYLTYRYTYVYDISQTYGKPLPLSNDSLNSNNKTEFLELLKSFSPYPILEENIGGLEKGYWSKSKEHIVLESTLSIDDKASVLLHELTHALYDDFDYKENRNLSETFVESVAFIVADYFDLDTEGDTKVLLELGDKIQKCANSFIKNLEDYYNNGNIRIAS